MADIEEETETLAFLLPCAVCGRTFRPESLQKHTTVCKRNATKKRKTFDSSRQRIQGTELAEFLTLSQMQQKKTADKKAETKRQQSHWRQHHLEFMRAIRAARGVSTPVSPRSAAVLTKPKEHEKCPHCERHFGPKAFDRHIEWCREQKARIPKSPASNKAKERLEARTKYRAPVLRRVSIRDKYSPHANHASVESSPSSCATQDSTSKTGTKLFENQDGSENNSPTNEVENNKNNYSSKRTGSSNNKTIVSAKRNNVNARKLSPNPAPPAKRINNVSSKYLSNEKSHLSPSVVKPNERNDRSARSSTSGGSARKRQPVNTELKRDLSSKSTNHLNNEKKSSATLSRIPEMKNIQQSKKNLSKGEELCSQLMYEPKSHSDKNITSDECFLQSLCEENSLINDKFYISLKSCKEHCQSAEKMSVSNSRNIDTTFTEQNSRDVSIHPLPMEDIPSAVLPNTKVYSSYTMQHPLLKKEGSNICSGKCEVMSAREQHNPVCTNLIKSSKMLPTVQNFPLTDTSGEESTLCIETRLTFSKRTVGNILFSRKQPQINDVAINEQVPELQVIQCKITNSENQQVPEELEFIHQTQLESQLTTWKDIKMLNDANHHKIVGYDDRDCNDFDHKMDDKDSNVTYSINSDENLDCSSSASEYTVNSEVLELEASGAQCLSTDQIKNLRAKPQKRTESKEILRIDEDNFSKDLECDSFISSTSFDTETLLDKAHSEDREVEYDSFLNNKISMEILNCDNHHHFPNNQKCLENPLRKNSDDKQTDEILQQQLQTSSYQNTDLISCSNSNEIVHKFDEQKDMSDITLQLSAITDNKAAFENHFTMQHNRDSKIEISDRFKDVNDKANKFNELAVEQDNFLFSHQINASANGNQRTYTQLKVQMEKDMSSDNSKFYKLLKFQYLPKNFKRSRKSTPHLKIEKNILKAKCVSARHKRISSQICRINIWRNAILNSNVFYVSSKYKVPVKVGNNIQTETAARSVLTVCDLNYEPVTISKGCLNSDVGSDILAKDGNSSIYKKILATSEENDITFPELPLKELFIINESNLDQVNAVKEDSHGIENTVFTFPGCSHNFTQSVQTGSETLINHVLNLPTVTNQLPVPLTDGSKEIDVYNNREKRTSGISILEIYDLKKDCESAIKVDKSCLQFGDEECISSDEENYLLTKGSNNLIEQECYNHGFEDSASFTTHKNNSNSHFSLDLNDHVAISESSLKVTYGDEISKENCLELGNFTLPNPICSQNLVKSTDMISEAFESDGVNPCAITNQLAVSSGSGNEAESKQGSSVDSFSIDRKFAVTGKQENISSLHNGSNVEFHDSYINGNVINNCSNQIYLTEDTTSHIAKHEPHEEELQNNYTEEKNELYSTSAINSMEFSSSFPHKNYCNETKNLSRHEFRSLKCPLKNQSSVENSVINITDTSLTTSLNKDLFMSTKEKTLKGNSDLYVTQEQRVAKMYDENCQRNFKRNQGTLESDGEQQNFKPPENETFLEQWATEIHPNTQNCNEVLDAESLEIKNSEDHSHAEFPRSENDELLSPSESARKEMQNSCVNSLNSKFIDDLKLPNLTKIIGTVRPSTKEKTILEISEKWDEIKNKENCFVSRIPQKIQKHKVLSPELALSKNKMKAGIVKFRKLPPLGKCEIKSSRHATGPADKTPELVADEHTLPQAIHDVRLDAAEIVEIKDTIDNMIRIDSVEEELCAVQNVTEERQSTLSKHCGDSAYSSLNRRSPQHGMQETDHFITISSSGSESSLPPLYKPQVLRPNTEDTSILIHQKQQEEEQSTGSSRLSKFCHECGSRYPVDLAKFCCECGVRRLLI